MSPSKGLSTKRTLPSSFTSFPVGCHRKSSATVACEARDGVGLSGFPAAPYSFSISSQRASLSCRSWLGRLRLRAGAGVLGMHRELDSEMVSEDRPDSNDYATGLTLTQWAHGNFLSHLILRVWQRWQARTRTGLAAENASAEAGASACGVGAVEDAMGSGYLVVAVSNECR